MKNLANCRSLIKIGIIALVVALVTSLKPDVFAQGNSGNNPITAEIEQHDTDIKAAIAQHDTDIYNDIDAHDGNMTTEHSGLDTKLDDILSAVQNGGPAASVPKTGQTTSFGTGDDGDLERGVAWPHPRFTDNLDGTVTDNLTNLIWDQNANRFGNSNWNTALSDCNGLAASDHVDLTDGSVAGDWRLANRFELESLLHMGFLKPAVPDTAGTLKWSQGDPFNDVQLTPNFYWSSTTWASDTANAWMVSFSSGFTGIRDKGDDAIAWCVQAGQ